MSQEVEAARSAGTALVAMESTIYSNLGLPSPANREALERCDAAVRRVGAVPAITAVLDGVPRVGLDAHEWPRILGPATKVAERDLPMAVVNGRRAANNGAEGGQETVGATTVSASLALAEAAGIGVFATGGIGGVHRGVEATGDISADLGAIARRSVVTVCAGAKVFLDLARTLEYLDTQSVPVLGWRTDTFPAFYAQSSGLAVTHRVDTAEEVAEAVLAQRHLGIERGVLVAVPIPAEQAIDGGELERAIEIALRSAESEGVTGAEVTPRVLAEISRATEGRSINANLALAENNAGVAAQIAVALSDL